VKKKKHPLFGEAREGLIEFSALPPPHELAKWTYEPVDSYRGVPFRRYVAQQAWNGIAEVVECPDGLLVQTHMQRNWQRSFRHVWAWWEDTQEQRPYRWHWIVFRKSDWKRRTMSEVVG
jgi:hypothetical protein